MAFRKIALFLFSLISLLGICVSCSCHRNNGVFRVAIDPSWYPLQFGEQQQCVNGYIEELLLTIAHTSGIVFEKVETNWDSLLDGLHGRRYDAVITSLPRYDFHLARYDFSENVLDLGSVLVVREGSKIKKLKDLSKSSLGVLEGADIAAILQKMPKALQKSYSNLSDLLDALENGDVKGALVDALDASAYVQGPYFGKLKIASEPLNQKGLHFAVLKGKHEKELNDLNDQITSLKQKKKLPELLKKWKLYTAS